MPEADVLITGDIRKCPAPLVMSAPANVIFTGFLGGDDYDRALEQADVIMVLTRHPLAVNRGACEAVYFERPLIISDLPAMTPLFPYAISVSNDSAGIARGIQSAIERHPSLVSACPRGARPAGAALAAAARSAAGAGVMLRALRRRGWVLLVAILVTTGCAYVVASKHGETYTAESTAVVSASSQEPADAGPGQHARGHLRGPHTEGRRDPSRVATALGTSVSDVQERLSVFNTTGTALLMIDYRGTSAANSIAGATAALRAIAGDYPVSPNIIPGSVGAVQAPTKASCLKERDRPRGRRRNPWRRTRATADGRMGAGRSEDRQTRGPKSGDRVADLARQRDVPVRGECADGPVEGAR